MGMSIGPKIGIEGESEFRKQIRNINDEYKSLEAETKMVAAQFEAMGDEQGKLEAESKQLIKQIDKQQEKMLLLEDAVEKAAKKYGENSTEAIRLKGVLFDTQTSITNLESKLRSTTSKLDDMASGLDDVEDAAKDAGDALGDAGNDALSFGDILGANMITEGASQIIDALGSVVEETREYRKIMASLEQSSAEAGYTVAETTEAYAALFGVLADEQSTATTLANLQALEAPQETLLELINATIGGWSKYGDSIPIDGLAEAINHTAKLGEVQGNFADILEWNGINVDEFNERLAECSTVEERLQLIMDEMTRQNLPAMGKAWQDSNKSIVEANKANANLQAQLARLGETIEPVFTALTNAAAWLLEGLNDVIDLVAGSPAAFDATAFAAANASGDYSILTEQTIALLEAEEGATSALGEYNDTLEETGEGHESLDEHIRGTESELKILQQEYTDAKNAARESIDSQVGYFDELATESEWTAEKIVENWLAQQNAFDNYTANLQKAQKMNMPQKLLDQLADGSEESMLILDALVNDSEMTMEEIAEAFADREQAADNMADTMAAIASEADEQMAEMARDIKRAAADVVDGAVEGIRENAPKYVDAVGGMASEGNRKFREVNMVNSPSRLYKQYAMWIGEGAVQGIEEMTDKYERAMGDLAKSGHSAYVEESLTHAQSMPALMAASTVASSTNTHHYGGFTFEIYQQAGESVEDLAYRVMDVIQAEIGRKEAGM